MQKHLWIFSLWACPLARVLSRGRRPPGCRAAHRAGARPLAASRGPARSPPSAGPLTETQRHGDKHVRWAYNVAENGAIKGFNFAYITIISTLLQPEINPFAAY